MRLGGLGVFVVLGLVTVVLCVVMVKCVVLVKDVGKGGHSVVLFELEVDLQDCFLLEGGLLSEWHQ